MRHSSAPTTRADTGEMMEVQSDDNASWASLTDEPLAMTPDASQDTLSQEQARCESAMVTENPDGELNTPTESRNDNAQDNALTSALILHASPNDVHFDEEDDSNRAPSPHLDDNTMADTVVAASDPDPLPHLPSRRRRRHRINQQHPFSVVPLAVCPCDKSMIARHAPLSSCSSLPTQHQSFMLLAVQSDPNIMYHDEELSLEEQVKRSIESTCGMTIICLNHTDPLNLSSNGLCLRTKWKRPDRETYMLSRAQLIFREKFCNYRNFNRMIHQVTWQNNELNGGSLYRHSNRRPGATGRFTSLTVNSMQSGYLFRPVSEMSHPEFTSKLVVFYDEILNFITARAPNQSEITIYHRLPKNMLWLTEEMARYAKNNYNGLMLAFVKMQGNASYPHVSEHCIYRHNHNTVTCEICLFEAYLPKLLKEINTA